MASAAGNPEAAPPDWLLVPSPFSSMRTSEGPGRQLVRVRGELDLLAAPRLSYTLGEARRRAPVVLVDLSDVTFMDCSGLRALLAASSAARRAHGQLTLVDPPANVERLFQLTGAAASLRILARVPAASACRRPSQGRRRRGLGAGGKRKRELG